MVYELRGVPCLELEQVTPDRKSIMASRSFGRPVAARHELAEAVAVYVARAAERMRR
jgi:DNA polymerase V